MCPGSDETHRVIDPRVADPVGAGRVRVGMLPPQFTRDLVTDERRGWAIELAYALGVRLGIEPVPVEFSGPDRLLEGLKAGACDMGFLPNNPSWSGLADFSHPFLQLDFTFLVPPGSPIGRIADADQSGVRIAVVDRHASTLALLSMLKHAKAVSAETLDDAFALLRDGQADLFASTRPQLLDDSLRLPGSKVLDDRYGVTFMALAVPKGQTDRLASINEFVREAKASGLVQQAIERAHWRGVRVLPF